MGQANSPPIAVIIEPHHGLAQTVAHCLQVRGYSALVSSTHAGAAAMALTIPHVSFLAAAAPAPGEGHDGAYLAVARAKSPGAAVVVMLSDPHEKADDAPAQAVRIVKPFSLSELATAIDQALADQLA